MAAKASPFHYMCTSCFRMTSSGGNLFGSPPPSSPSKNINTNANDNDEQSGRMLRCPPSTAKKGRGGMSRLFAITDNSPNFDRAGDDDEDVSPRDVGDFPFFAASPSSNTKKRTGKENSSTTTRGGDLNHVLFHQPRSPPQCPPSTLKKKKPNHRLLDLNMERSPPKGLRTLGRANSFMQMFSQDSMVDGENEDGLKDIKEDGNAELNDGDNFIHKPKRQDSTGQFSFNRQDSTTGQMGERQESKGQ